MEARGRRAHLLALVDIPPPVLSIADPFWVPPFLQLSCCFIRGGSGALRTLQTMQKKNIATSDLMHWMSAGQQMTKPNHGTWQSPPS